MEIWKDIVETESLYSISNYGRVKRKKRKVKSSISPTGYRTLKERISNFQDNGKGYLGLYVQIQGKRTLIYAHRLVAMYFIPNPKNLHTVNHKDGNKSNNHFENLEWMSLKDNIQHAFKTGLSKGKKGRLAPKGKDSTSSLPISFFDKGVFIKNYESMRLAAKDLQIGHGSISSICLGKSNKTIQGYTFKLIQ